jgi:hypothetical protein
MKRCSYCGRDNNDDAAQCLECDTKFEPPSAPALPETGQPEYEIAPLAALDRQKDFVTLITCRTLMAADIVVGRLQAAGISAFLPDENLMQAIGWNFNTFGYVRVQVSPNDYDAAKALLTGTEADA